MQEPATSVEFASLDTGCTTWPAAAALARAVLAPSSAAAGAVRGARVVELGAGTGLAGLACAAGGAAAVVLTDLQARLPLLVRNVRRNGWVRTVGGCVVSCAPLDWFEPEAALAAEPTLMGADATLLIGADLVHDLAQSGPLAAAVCVLLAAWPNCAGLLWSQQRHCALATSDLRARLERDAGLTFEAVGDFPGGELLLGRRGPAGVAAPDEQPACESIEPDEKGAQPSQSSE